METWLPVAGFEGLYEVSDLGRVRGVDRLIVRGQGNYPVRGVVLSPGLNSSGLLMVSLRRDGRRHSKMVHRLVAEAFVSGRADGLEVCHNDGNALNNRADNLRWDTHSANELDKIKHGTHNMKNKTHCPRGHEYDEANTKIYRGRRFCRQCKRERGGN